MNFNKNILIWAVTFFILIGIYNLFGSMIGEGRITNYAFSDFLTKVEEKQITDVVIQGRTIEGRLVDGRKFSTYTPPYPNLVDKLKENGVRFEAVPLETKMNSFIGILLSWFPILLLIGVWVFFMRQMQGGGGKAMGFGKSRAKLLTEKTGKVTFKDVAGVDEAKEDLVEIVEFLKNPAKFQMLGGKIPKGCLLIGPPGTGKTMLARAVAGEANVPFFTVSGSDFVEMFVGVGASRVRDMFEQGKKSAPCIIFIDEIDAVGRHRGIGLGGGNDEREQTLNQILVEMDGFESNEGVIMIAATNRPDVLDPALLRPGRFDRQIIVPVPDLKGREEILRVHLKKVKTGPDVDPRIIARGTPGFSGADLSNLVNEAALLAARRDKRIVMMDELESAKDKVMMGAERRSIVISDEEKKLTAYHEGGHALVAIFCPASDPVHKATIIPRGRALGLVMRLPEKDRVSVTREKLKADLAVAMAGRVAEEIIFGHEKVTSGASSDIKQATRMAKAMVSEWGMSDIIGPIYHGGEERDVYIGGSKDSGEYSDETARAIDQEIKRLVNDGYDRAKNIIEENIDKLHAIADALIKFETLTGKEIKDIIDGKFSREEESSSSSFDEDSNGKATRKTSLPTIDDIDNIEIKPST